MEFVVSLMSDEQRPGLLDRAVPGASGTGSSEGTSEIPHLVIAIQLLRRHASAIARPSES
jgi:hypothetical protein